VALLNSRYIVFKRCVCVCKLVWYGPMENWLKRWVQNIL